MIYSIITQLIAPISLKRNPFISVLVLSMLIATQLSAQSADTLFKQGRELAYRNQFDSALIFLHLACAAQPRDMDMRLTLGRVYAWKKDYQNAEINVQVVTTNQPKNREALTVLADIYLWSKNWVELDNITQKALNPLNATAESTGVKDSVVFIQKYAAGLIEQKLYQEAVNEMKPFRVELKKRLSVIFAVWLLMFLSDLSCSVLPLVCTFKRVPTLNPIAAFILLLSCKGSFE